MDTSDFDRYFKESIKPINGKMLEQEKVKHEDFLKRHSNNFDRLSEKHSSSIYQLITLEGVILTAIVVLSNPEQNTIWLFLGICLILFSMMFGIWLQNIAIQSDYQSHKWNYYQELKNNWWSRELWGDQTVKMEREIVEPRLENTDLAYKKTYTYHILKFLRLNHDRVENIFRVSFLIALFCLIIHFVTVWSAIKNKPIKNSYVEYHNRFNSR